ncbi:FtsX-like permease family protein [Phycicoccus sp.]|uniref:FtsX-like permease family protein n=1 Tax=Phycicoccus sp. TaxID=1902410 RepID=UPI002C58B61D|nr:FtsX-like permease family protein [Phycicoccus sp.]HMM96915.1 FtsX-like permease family protein [Phycicoccus sp.]
MSGRRHSGAVTRAALSAAVVLSALCGPVYLREALSSVVRDTVGQAPVSRTGLTLSSTSSSPDTLAGLVPADLRRWYADPVEQSRVGVAVQPRSVSVTSGHVLWRDGACAHVEIRVGHCPTAAGEVLAEASLAERLGWAPGTAFRVSEFAGSTAFPEDLPVIPLRVVGLYTQRPDPRYWFDERLETAADVGPLVSSMGTLLTDRATMTTTGPTPAGPDATWARTDDRVDLAYRPDAVGLDEVLAAGPRVQAFVEDPAASAAGGVVVGNGRWLTVTSRLPALADTVVTGRAQALVTVPLLAGALTALVAYVFWLAVRAAAQDRRPEAAVTRLRGQGPAGVRRLLVGELLPAVLVGLPLGVLATAGLAVAVARWWFEPTPEVTVDRLTVLVGIGAVLVPPLLTWAAARRVAGERIVALLRAVPARVGRRSVNALEAVVGTLAVAGFVGVVQGSVVGSAALAAPMLLALAAGLAAARLTTAVTARLGPGRLEAGRLLSGLALTRTARRGLARWVVPVVATATALLVVATSAMAGADRAYRLQSLVDLGAPVVLDVATVRPPQLVAAVAAADPTGRSTPLVRADPGDPSAVTTLAVDSTRVRRVARLPAGIPASAWERLLPGPVPPRVVTGTRLTLTAESDGFVAEQATQEVSLTLDYLGADGTPGSTLLGAVTGRPRRVPVAVDLPCSDGCRLVGLTLDAQSSPGPQGQVSILDPALDGRPADLGPPAEWLPLRDPTTQASASELSPTGGRRGVLLDVDFAGGSRVEVHQASIPYAVPALLTRRSVLPTGVRSGVLSGGSRPMAPVATAEYLPGGGPKAVLVDLTTVSGFGWAPQAGITSHVLVADDDPDLVASVRRGLTGHGVTVLGEHRAADAAAAYARSAPGWSLRLGAVLAVLALVVAGAAVAAVVGSAAPAARREYAAARLLGAGRRAVGRVALGELLPPVVVGVLVGAVSGFLAAAVTLDRLPLYVVAPPVDVTRPPTSLALGVATTLVALVALVALCAVLARWVTRATGPDRLVEAE